MSCDCSTCWVLLGLFAAIVIISFVWEHLRSSKRITISNQAVFITGCDSGFGNLTAKALDKLNVRVFAGCLTEEGAKQLTKESSKRVTAFICDVTKEDHVQKAFDTIKTACSQDGLTFWGLVNNAGIVCGFTLDFSTLESFKRTFDVNFFGTVSTCKTFLPLLKQSQGRVVNVASLAGYLAGPGMGAYAASKFAVEGFSDSFRREMQAWGVNVSIIEPGFMRTPLVTDLARKNVEKFISSAPQSLRDEYGPDYIKATTNRVEMASSRAADPMDVVNAIVDALLTTTPRHRYMMPMEARLLYWGCWLPSFIGDAVVRLGGPPLPASVLARRK